MSQFTLSPPPKRPLKNSPTRLPTDDKQRKDGDGNSSKPMHHLLTAVPRRTAEQHPSMPQVRRGTSEEHQVFIPSLSTVEESGEENSEEFSANEIEKYAKQINDLLQKSCPNAKSPSSRALNVLRHVAGGGDFFPDVSHPEIEAFASASIELSDQGRLVLLKSLTNELRHQLSRKQDIRISNALEYLGAAGTSIHDRSLINSRLRRLQRILGELIHEVETWTRDSAPRAAEMLALEAKTMITTHTDLEENGTARAIKLIYCAAGGSIYVNPKQPETGAFAKRLRDLSNNLRFEYLQFLYGKLASYLTTEQQMNLGKCLAHITAANRKKENNLEYFDFADFRRVVKAELDRLSVKIPPFN